MANRKKLHGKHIAQKHSRNGSGQLQYLKHANLLTLRRIGLPTFSQSLGNELIAGEL
jgi:hypothetical protein